MSFSVRSRKTLLSALLGGCLGLAAALPVQALEHMHLLVPGGAGGGWDSTARGVGEALSKSGLVTNVSYENLSGGGGGKAIAHLIETAGQNSDTLMVNSTPIVIRSLAGIYPQSFRDLTPVAATLGDFAALVVRKDSPFENFTQMAEAYRKNPRAIKVSGGSARGSMDHLVAAMMFRAAGGDARQLRYVAYDAGGEAMAGLLSGETQVLSTGFSEALTMAAAGEVRILVMSGDERNAVAADVPTMKELGFDMSFINWRGFFAAPGISDADKQTMIDTLKAMYATDEWKVVRDRNGWLELFRADQDFVKFLEQQEQELSVLMKELGFLL